MELSEANIIMPFDDLVRKLPTTLTNVAIPTSIYRSRFQAYVIASRRSEGSSVAWRAERVWRIVPGQEEGGQLGYRIKQGVNEEPSQGYPFAHITAS